MRDGLRDAAPTGPPDPAASPAGPDPEVWGVDGDTDSDAMDEY